jgi:hypothetical protein
MQLNGLISTAPVCESTHLPCQLQVQLHRLDLHGSLPRVPVRQLPHTGQLLNGGALPLLLLTGPGARPLQLNQNVVAVPLCAFDSPLRRAGGG